MNPTTGADLCRIALVAPGRRIDLSLPADVPLAHMLPTLLQAAGRNLANAGLAHSGWVLQRLDEAPFDESQSLAALGVRDGEVLYFRPEMSQLPEVVFDDVADVVATGINEHADRWRPELTRRFGLTASAAALAFGAFGLAFVGPPWQLIAIAAGVMAALLLLAGIVLSRALGDAVAGAVLGYSAVPYAFLAGLLAPARPISLTSLGALHVLAALAAVTLVCVVAAFAIEEGLPIFLGVAFTALIGVVAAGAVQGFGLSPEGTAAFVASLFLGLTALIPSISFRLARLPLPPVPENAEELRSAARTFDGPSLLRRTRDADRFATGLIAGVGLTGLAAQLSLSPTGGWLEVAMSLCLSLVLLLRARVFHGRAQRIWMLGSGLAGLVLLGMRDALTETPARAILFFAVPLLLGVAITMTMAIRLPTRKPSPFWGRAGDILDLFLILSLFPLAMGLLNLYTALRGLAD
ncbi:type VII secretion integral membrane protein EccD [Actinomadura barringtoniae]|uniref:Type VII secretion integral membrane protein EccD n=1 Tax=Actinomadura barringtoniae TaxID=1427535 RepID=A0A939PDJ3_9ACTN|nr:type VII secretion integral membrane protein EccD [Actinomadura barringtoniae]MBO2447274.1 type VII secretion integral membrane protein EccD [Actinomadura barringtoniae]